MGPLAAYREIWAIDFEFTVPNGGRPIPICCVGRELHTGQLRRDWLDGREGVRPIYPCDKQTLIVAYYASAELGCYIALGWPMPMRILDLFVEFRCRTSGLSVPSGSGLLGAMRYFGLDCLSGAAKEELRALAIRGGPFTEQERLDLLDYCESDVNCLAKLLPLMLPEIDLPRALLRGRYMTAAARMEWNGVPLDADTLHRLLANWTAIKSRLVGTIDRDYGVFVPQGQRRLDPESDFGAAMIDEAAASGLNPHRLADAVLDLWQEEREAARESVEARRAARKETGLTVRRIHQWENSGYDHSSYPGLDTAARDLAGRYPALGIGRGYVQEENYDNTDYAGSLWELLRNPDIATPVRHDPDLIGRAASRLLIGHGSEPAGPLTFSAQRWAAYLIRKGIPWPRLDSGKLALDANTFKEMAKAYPAEVGPIRELLYTLSQMRLNALAVGEDGRNRTLLSAFRSSTGRNQPSNTRFIFGPSCWLRSLIQPRPGRAVAYCDWSQQELAIAASLSGDVKMQEAYISGDFYLTFAKMAGAVPADATKQSHAAQRDQFKVVALGVLYGLSADGLARRLSVPPCRGRELLRMHRETFPAFWRWSDAVEAEAMLRGKLRTVFGWAVHVPGGVDPRTGRSLANPRSVRNFPCQAHGAEMLRLACCLATERGIMVCAPVHDALLVEGDADEIEQVVARTQEAMREASEAVLPGFPLRTEAKTVRYPERYSDPRGAKMWGTICELLGEVEANEPLSPAIPPVWSGLGW